MTMAIEIDGVTIEHDKAVRLAVDHLKRKHPRSALIPFGSAATGETTKMRGSSWASDIEIGIVGSIRTRLFARRASRFLSAVLDRDVEVFWIRPARLRRGSRRNFGSSLPNLHAFNLARSEVIGTLPRRARPVKVWQPDELPAGEGLILILNRIGESMMRGSEYGDAKVAMSCGDALLIAHGSYGPTYEERFHALRALLEMRPDLLGPEAPDHAQAILWGYGFKVDEARRGERPSADALRSAVAATVASITGSPNTDTTDLVAGVQASMAAARAGERESRLHVAIRGAYSVFRGRAHVAPRLGMRLIGREPVEIRVYAAMLASYLGDAAAAPLDPAMVADGRATLERLWRAYCY